ncbi:Peroxisome biosynthesis protein pex1 [Stygiomarasmius scandens]|uniref:Peroxisomal ATPase PEX1 n=1 Tax=Marasmiellus scandens TaxID=2682957 RepID=A0ABR1K642_9AGAR
MPRRARIHFVSLRSSLVNLPISIYGPLLERSIRPQNLAVHLTLVPSQGKVSKNEAYVGWTGMASASSLAQFNSASSGEGFETIEIDPQYAQGLGFSQGDVVEIGLLHDMPVAKSVGTEPLTSDDWEIIEIHASHVESTLLSQVRVAKIGQEIDVWVLGRTRVRLKVVSLDPRPKNNALLLSTNTEVSIAPKLHSRQQKALSKSTSKDNSSSSNGTPITASSSAKSKPTLNTTSQTLRVLPRRVPSLHTPTYNGTEILGYVSLRTFANLFPSTEPGTTTYRKVAYRRLQPPSDPSESQSGQEPALPAPKVLNPGEKEKDKSEPVTESDDVFICSTAGIVEQHIVFPNLPKDVEEWDLVRFIAEPGAVTLLPTLEDANELASLHTQPQSTNFLAGVDEILQRCTDFCINRLAIHAQKASVRGVSSLLVTGRGGVGKTSIVKTVAKSLQCNSKTYTYTLYVDVSPYSDKPVSTIKRLFKYWYEKAWWHKPTILILDNLHELVGTESEHQDSFRTRHITELFLSMYSSAARSASSNTRGIILFATAPSSAALHPLISTAHLFDEVVNLMPPNKDARKDILTKIANDRFAASKDLRQDPDAPLNFTYLATQTEGYSATDLQDLVSRAIHQLSMRMISDGGLPLLRLSDFEAAREGFVPLSLRDIKLEKSTTSWDDIGGLHETRRVLRETLEWPTKYGPIFKQSPLRLRSGLLLYGYPGCGKTLLASAVAKECGLNFIGVKGPEILNKYIGASEKTVRDIFERASSAKPCVLFFDEFDSIAPKRGHDSTGVTDRVVNQMLTQMDGAEGLDGVYVLAATSRPDLIDSALLRPGRLDKALLCNMPDISERKDILEAVSRKIALSPEVDLQEVTEATEGFSGADLQALMYNAHLEVVNESIASSASSENTVSTDKEIPIQYTTIGGQSKPLKSKAEEAALQRRLRQIQAANQPRVEKSKGAVKAVAPNKRQITQDHIRKVLKTTRPSVSLEERRRLDRIYQAFMSDRSGELPVPPEGNGIGIRATLG